MSANQDKSLVIRVSHLSKTERRMVLLLTPEERRVALVEAARHLQHTLNASLSGDDQPSLWESGKAS